MLAQLAIFLAAAVIAVPLSRKLGLGAVLGYLGAGMLIGPFGFRLIDDVDAILHISEFGVILLLFIIGLELQPSRLWVLRRQVFGLGAAQVAATGLVLGAIALAFGWTWQAALVAGLGKLATQGAGSSRRIARILLLDEPASIDAGEITDKGYLNQRAVLARRAPLVEGLHAGAPYLPIITV